DDGNYRRSNGLACQFFGFYVGKDRRNVNKNMPQLSQGGTTQPDRDYYLVENSRNNDIKEAYKKYIGDLFQLTGSTPEQASENFNSIWKIESALAKAQKSRVEMRDPQKTYNKFSLEDLSKQTAPLNWTQILPALKINGADSVLVNNPNF